MEHLTVLEFPLPVLSMGVAPEGSHGESVDVSWPDVATPRQKAPGDKAPIKNLAQGKATPHGHEFEIDHTALEIDERIPVRSINRTNCGRVSDVLTL